MKRGVRLMLIAGFMLRVRLVIRVRVSIRVRLSDGLSWAKG